MKRAFINIDDNKKKPYLYIDTNKHPPEDIPFTFMGEDNHAEYVYIEATSPDDSVQLIEIQLKRDINFDKIKKNVDEFHKQKTKPCAK